MVFINLIKYFFYKRSKDRIFFSSLVILILLFLRSLIESSFAVFGVDFILVFTSWFIMNKKFNNQNDFNIYCSEFIFFTKF